MFKKRLKMLSGVVRGMGDQRLYQAAPNKDVEVVDCQAPASTERIGIRRWDIDDGTVVHQYEQRQRDRETAVSAMLG
jgi:hypothetical protein